MIIYDYVVEETLCKSGRSHERNISSNSRLIWRGNEKRKIKMLLKIVERVI